MARGTKEQYREQMAAKVAAAQEVLAAEVGSLVSGGRLAPVPQFPSPTARLQR